MALLARGAHLDAIKARGLEVRTPEERFTVAVEASDDAVYAVVRHRGAEAGLLLGTFSISSLVGNMLGGAITDKFGRPAVPYLLIFQTKGNQN